MHINKYQHVIHFLILLLLLLIVSFLGFFIGKETEKEACEKELSQYQHSVMEQHLTAWYSIQQNLQRGNDVNDPAVISWLQNAVDTYETAYHLDRMMSFLKSGKAESDNPNIIQYYQYLVRSASLEEDTSGDLSSDLIRIADWICRRGENSSTEQNGIPFYTLEDFSEIKDSLHFQDYLDD